MISVPDEHEALTRRAARPPPRWLRSGGNRFGQMPEHQPDEAEREERQRQDERRVFGAPHHRAPQRTPHSRSASSGTGESHRKFPLSNQRAMI